MVEEGAKAGEKALSGWLRRCRATVEELATFVRLMEMLVDQCYFMGYRQVV